MKHSEKYYRRKAKRELIKYFLIFLGCIGLYLVLIIALSVFHVLQKGERQNEVMGNRNKDTC